MAFPFGSTSLGSYLMWAQSVGCTCENGYGGMHGSVFWKITAPSGKHLVIVGVQQNERLTSYSINYYDRRLGLQSPFERAPYEDGEA